MANDKAFKVKNGILAQRYLQSAGTETAGSNTYDLASASYDGVSFSVAGQETVPTKTIFNSDGTKMYVTGNANDTVFQYSLSTAFDISTTSYDSVSFSFATQDTQPYGIYFKPDGTKLYMAGSNNDTVYQYSLSTAFDISTTSYDSVSFSAASQDLGVSDLAFNSTGTKMYIVGNGNDAVYQYSLSTAWDISTASYDSISLSVAGQDITARSIWFNGAGTKLFMVGSSNASGYQYSLSTAFDLSTASYDNISFSLTSEDATPFGVTFNTTGTKMYVTEYANDRVYQYSTVAYTQTLDLSTGTYFSFTPSGATTVSFTNPPASGLAIGFAVEINGDGSAITWPASVKWPAGTAPTATATKEIYTFITTDGGTTYYGKQAATELA